MKLIEVNYDSEQPTVSARELHSMLEVGTAFKDWMPRMIEYGFEEGKDFSSKLSESTGGRPSKEYNLSVDMAKQICMIQRTEKGKECRQYFIDLEKAWNTPERIMERALIFAHKSIEDLKHQVVIMKPKADFFDAVADSKTAIPMDQVAKTIGRVGRNQLFEILRENNILMQNNVPYQKYIDNGYFRVVEQKYSKPDGEICINIKTLVYQKGAEYIRRLLERR